MTCIVAGAGWMAADRRITSDGSSSSLVKIAQNPHLIAAASGNATSTLDVRCAVRRGVDTPEALLPHVDRSSYALVLLPSGQIVRIEDGRVWPPVTGLQAIGSGGDLALGWLSCALAAGEVDRASIRQAFRFVAAHRVDCGGGPDIRSL